LAVRATMKKIIHLMIRAQDLERSIVFYTRAFGLSESHRLEFPTFKLVYLRDQNTGFEIELTWNQGQTEPYSHGSGYGHVAFCTDDLEACRDQLVQQGHQPGDIKTLPVSGPAAPRFFFVTDPDGYKIEVLERAGHYV
jgi:lactoylglutathione lyase